MIIYKPLKKTEPERKLNVPSSWEGLERIIEDILDRFRIQRESAIEFGVWYGYSLVALSNYFKTIYGVDHFKGDIHAGISDKDMVDKVIKSMEPYKNIIIQNIGFEQFIEVSILNEYLKHSKYHFNLAHIDIIHEYAPTYICGAWCCEHSDIVLFHDTESFSEVKRACENLAVKYDRVFYNYEPFNGLGILAKKE